MIINKQNFYWLLIALTLIGLASQCSGSLPPLPATSTDPVIRIALLIPASGELNTFGRMMQNGIVLAFDAWNQQGGVLDHQLEWTIYDTDCTFETARQATQQAIDDGFQFIIGPICSEAALAAATLAESAHTLIILPAATHPLVTVNHQDQTRSTIFRVSYSYAWQGQTAAHFAREVMGVNKVALLTQPSNQYTTQLANVFAQEFKAKGGNIVDQATYNSDKDDFTEDLKAIDQAGAELIYLPASSLVANRVAQQLNELGLYKTTSTSKTGLLLLGSDAWEADTLALTVMEGSYFPVHFLVEDKNRDWVETYKSAYATQPSTLSALGYDAANLLAEAIEQAGTVDPTIVAVALEQGIFEGVTGQISFDYAHNPIKPIPFLYISNGETVLKIRMKDESEG